MRSGLSPADKSNSGQTASSGGSMPPNDNSRTAYNQPTVARTAEGQPRKVGYELEFTGLELLQVSALVETVFSGQRSDESAAATTVNVTGLGNFKIELDWHYLKKKAAWGTPGE